MPRSAIFAIVCTTIVGFSGCTSPSSEQESSEIAKVEQELRKEQIGMSEMLARKRAIYRSHSGLDEYQELYYDKVISYAKQLEAGKLTFEQFMVLEREAQQNMELMQKVNCLSVREENKDDDRSGLASTNGFVAIVSMGGLLADAASEARACK